VGETLTLNPWSPLLVRGWPVAMVLHRLDGAVIADLFSAGDEEDQELVVGFVSPRPRPERAIDTLLGWAATVGSRRVWLLGRVVDLDPPAHGLGAAKVRCPTCGLQWRDESPKFWHRVRCAGAFPGLCVGCGGSLPEWRVVDGEPADPDPEPEPVERSGVAGSDRCR